MMTKIRKTAFNMALLSIVGLLVACGGSGGGDVVKSSVPAAPIKAADPITATGTAIAIQSNYANSDGDLNSEVYQSVLDNYAKTEGQ